jgi:hypothetical protein
VIRAVLPGDSTVRRNLDELELNRLSVNAKTGDRSKNKACSK